MHKQYVEIQSLYLGGYRGKSKHTHRRKEIRNQIIFTVIIELPLNSSGNLNWKEKKFTANDHIEQFLIKQ